MNKSIIQLKKKIVSILSKKKKKTIHPTQKQEPTFNKLPSLATLS